MGGDGIEVDGLSMLELRETFREENNFRAEGTSTPDVAGGDPPWVEAV